MKYCPTCQEEFEDELNYCTFDGAVLDPPDDDGRSSPNATPQDAGAVPHQPDCVSNGEEARPRNPWKTAFLALLVAVLVGGALLAYIFSRREPRPADPQTARARARDAAAASSPPTIEEPKTAPISQLSRSELLNLLPKNLMRRFHQGEPGQGSPDDLRIVEGDDGEYIVLVGAGKFEGARRTVAERLLILKYEEDQFHDLTRQCLPPVYGSGAVVGQRAQVRFDTAGSNLIVRVPASSTAIVDECPSCEHAYQRVTLEWKGVRYVESEREWDNDRYTAFYVVAEALERRRVDGRARPLIDKTVDPAISQGFARTEKKGWIVENLTEDNQATSADYELRNGADRLTITVSKTNGQWRATRVRSTS